MFRQYYAQRFRSMYPPVPRKVGRKTVYKADPRDRQIGTIPVGTILYIQWEPMKASVITILERSDHDLLCTSAKVCQ
jgi:hypothetical protein